MARKIDVESGNPYRDDEGHFGTSPDEKLKASFAELAKRRVVSHEDNKKKIEKAKKEAKKLLAQVRKDDTDKASVDEVMRSYSGNGNLYLNSELRKAKGDDSKLKPEDLEDVKVIDAQMKDDMSGTTLYRGTYGELENITEGAVFTDYGFGSSSKDEKVSVDYADPNGDQGAADMETKSKMKNPQSYVFEIAPSRGLKAVDMEAHGWEANDMEKEVLLPRGLTYKITKVTKDVENPDYVDEPYNYTLVEVTIVPAYTKEEQQVLAKNANITPDEQRQIDLATEQFRQSVERVDNQILQQYIQAIQDGDYAEAERILEQAQESPQVNTLMFALLTIGVILLPLYARQRIQNLLQMFGLHTVYANTNEGQAALRQQAEKGAKSHVRTIAKDIKNNLDDAIDEELTNPVIEAGVKEKYEELADKDGKEFVKAVKNDEDIYKFARDLILAGESRNTIIKKLQETFTTVSKRRAKVIAGNEANRVFTMSQFEADEQFLAQNQLTDKAYKRLVSNTGTPEAICAAIIRKTAAKPIPFHQDFIPFNKTFTTKGDNGKTYTFKPTYEHLKSGHIHVNCHCRYELLIKRDDGTFMNTFTWKVMNEADFEEVEHPRAGDGKFKRKGGVADLSKLDTVSKFNDFIADHYFEGTFGDYEEDSSDAVRAYQGHYYDAINSHARKKQLDDAVTVYNRETTYGEIIEDINVAANIALESDITLYRGVDAPYSKLSRVGDVINSRSFLSTSVDASIARKFVPLTSRGEYSGSLFIITAKKGQKVALPDLVTFGKRGKTMGEGEVLIPSGSTLTVIKIVDEVVYAELN